MYPIYETDSDSSDKIETENDYKPPKIQYNILIKTSDFSEDCSNIGMKICGEKYQSNMIKLNSTPSDNDKQKFLRDSLDAFKTEEVDVHKVNILSRYISISSTNNLKM